MTINRIKKILFFTLFLFLLPSPVLAENLGIKSFGHSSFLISGDKKLILLNPFKSFGCTSDLEEPKNVSADFILASSKLADEGYNPNNKLMFVEPGTYNFKDTILNGITIPHDRIGGRRLGLATVWKWEQNNLKIVHMAGAAGDLDINTQIVLSRPDILFISIGGGIKSYDGEEAARITKILEPSIVIPVHFVTGQVNKENCDLSNSDLFLENMKDFKVKYVGSNVEINSKKIDQNTIYFFNY